MKALKNIWEAELLMKMQNLSDSFLFDFLHLKDCSRVKFHITFGNCLTFSLRSWGASKDSRELYILLVYGTRIGPTLLRHNSSSANTVWSASWTGSELSYFLLNFQKLGLDRKSTLPASSLFSPFIATEII